MALRVPCLQALHQALCRTSRPNVIILVDRAARQQAAVSAHPWTAGWSLAFTPRPKRLHELRKCHRKDENVSSHNSQPSSAGKSLAPLLTL